MLELPEEELLAEWPLHLFLDDARERSRTEVCVVPLLGEVAARGRRDLELDVLRQELQPWTAR